MKKLIIGIVSGLSLLMLLQISGCEGISGPRGETGDQGDPGDPYKVPDPGNRLFSLGITNNSLKSHNGAPKIYLAFDTLHSNTGDTVVCQKINGGVVPTVDGFDGGDAEWGAKSSTVALVKEAGSNNFISSAIVRSAFDAQYVYFLIKWTEVENASFGLEKSLSADAGHWNHPSDLTNTGELVQNPLVWDYVTGSQDRMMMFFEITPVTFFDHDGCNVTCHTFTTSGDSTYHATRGSRQFMDVWSWSAATSNPTGYAQDRYLDATANFGSKEDVGTPLSRPNRLFTTPPLTLDTIERPLYQSINDPNFNAPAPLWDWQIANLSDTGWVAGSTIPLFLTTVPTGSEADVVAIGRFNNGTWTVELKRARITGNGDDVQFR